MAKATLSVMVRRSIGKGSRTRREGLDGGAKLPSQL